MGLCLKTDSIQQINNCHRHKYAGRLGDPSIIFLLQLGRAVFILSYASQLLPDTGEIHTALREAGHDLWPFYAHSAPLVPLWH